MAVTGVNESVASRSASLNVGEGFRYTRSFTVQVDDPNTSLLTIMGAPGVKLWSRHPNDYWALAHSFDVKPRGGSMMLYDVTVNYKPPEQRDENREEQDPDTAVDPAVTPLAMPDVVWTGGANLVEVPAVTANGNKPIVNSAGVPYADATKRKPGYTLSCVKCYPTYTAASTAIDALVGHVNSAAWAGKAAREWLCESARWSWKSESNGNQRLAYIEVQYEISYSPGGHDLQLIDMGYQERKSGKLEPILGGDGKPIKEPAALDGTGLVMEPPPSPTKPPITNKFEIFFSNEFGGYLGSPPDKLKATPTPPPVP